MVLANPTYDTSLLPSNQVPFSSSGFFPLNFLSKVIFTACAVV